MSGCRLTNRHARIRAGSLRRDTGSKSMPLIFVAKDSSAGVRHRRSFSVGSEERGLANWPAPWAPDL